MDIGANDCSLLNEFKKNGAKTIAVEPTNAIKDGHGKWPQKFQSYFNRKIAKKILKNFGQIDFITFTNVFAHINNLQELINNLKILISNKTIVIIENHYLDQFLKENNLIHFIQNLRTYSLSSFLFIARNLNMNLEFVEFPSRYGGNIRVFLNKKNNLLSIRRNKYYSRKEKIKKRI